MLSSIGPTIAEDSSDPPGMILGPLSAPSSPPLTPVPTKCSPRSASAAVRLWVSWYRALPPSITMSPSSSSGTSSSMTASVGLPACTMIRMLRGRESAPTNSSTLPVGTKSPSPPCAAISASVRAWVRLCRTTWWPCRARLRARLAPMTARPVTPICELMDRSCRSRAAVDTRSPGFPVSGCRGSATGAGALVGQVVQDPGLREQDGDPGVHPAALQLRPARAGEHVALHPRAADGELARRWRRARGIGRRVRQPAVPDPPALQRGGQAAGHDPVAAHPDVVEDGGGVVGQPATEGGRPAVRGDQGELVVPDDAVLDERGPGVAALDGDGERG